MIAENVHRILDSIQPCDGSGGCQDALCVKCWKPIKRVIILE
jgi:hypothetical protein